jgi:hypothetical protein
MFKHDALIILETYDGNTGPSQSLVWSTFPGLQSMIKNEVSPLITVITLTYEDNIPQILYIKVSELCMLQSREADPNFDSVNDFLDIEFLIPLPTNTSVRGVHLVLLFEFRLNVHFI